MLETVCAVFNLMLGSGAVVALMRTPAPFSWIPEVATVTVVFSVIATEALDFGWSAAEEGFLVALVGGIEQSLMLRT